MAFALFEEKIRRWRYHATLELEDPRVARPDADKTQFRGPVFGFLGDVYYFRLAITNTGTAAAHDVQVYLARVDRVIGNDTSPVDRFIPMNLLWAHIRKPTLPVLLPGMPRRFCDFAHITNPATKETSEETLPGVAAGDAVLALDLEVRPNSLGHLLEPGTYRFTIILAASECAPHQETLEVVFPGQWHENEQTMFDIGFKMRKL